MDLADFGREFLATSKLACVLVPRDLRLSSPLQLRVKCTCTSVTPLNETMSDVELRLWSPLSLFATACAMEYGRITSQ